MDVLRNPESEIETDLREWKQVTTSVTTSNEDVYRLYRQSVEDMAALRLPPDDIKDELIPAAGVPWFVAVFGRDSLIPSAWRTWSRTRTSRAARSTFWAGCKRLRSTISAMRSRADYLHEIRVGELAQRKLIPHTPYYGTADATALYLITLHEAWKWLGDDQLFRDHEAIAKRCLEWIDHYGDLDGDGLQEYQTRSPQGYENMGWKDARDSVVYPDGSPVKGPKALCELQGYTYDAWLRMAHAFEYFNQPELARALRGRCAELRATVRGAVLVRGNRILCLRARRRQGAGANDRVRIPDTCSGVVS